MNTQGWTKDDYQTFHDLKVKANIFNLQVASKILKDEVADRARASIRKAYYEVQA